jgi:hypothetical protein
MGRHASKKVGFQFNVASVVAVSRNPFLQFQNDRYDDEHADEEIRKNFSDKAGAGNDWKVANREKSI